MRKAHLCVVIPQSDTHNTRIRWLVLALQENTDKEAADSMQLCSWKVNQPPLLTVDFRMIVPPLRLALNP